MFDVVIIGAGVIGLSIARSLAEKTSLTALIIEKEESYGRETSSRNSEVIHSGIYYEKNSLKLKHCLDGKRLLYNYCKDNNIWFNNCGKLIIANNSQIDSLEALFKKAKENGLDGVHELSKKEILKIEQNLMADNALYIKSTGILSSHDLMTSFYIKSKNKDHDYLFKSKVVDVKQLTEGYELAISNPNGEIEKLNSKWVVNSSGLESGIISQMLSENSPKLRYSKGSYFKLSSKWRNKFKRLIYPLPDSKNGSLGIHLTIDKSAEAKLGPDAEWINFNKIDYSVNKNSMMKFFDEGARYLKNLKVEDLTPDYSGIRPKIYDKKNVFPDFYIQHEEKNGYPGWINLIGIESPGLTASISIGNEISSIIS